MSASVAWARSLNPFSMPSNDWKNAIASSTTWAPTTRASWRTTVWAALFATPSTPRLPAVTSL